jgi:thioredoxin 1
MITIPLHNQAMPVPPDSPDPASTPLPARWVACLCAQWCGTCRDYRPLFDQVAARHGDCVFVWVDIEDEADLVGDLEVESFPTVLVGQGERLVFAGPLLPHAATLSRLLSALDGQEAAVSDPALQSLATALQRRIASG